MNKFERERSESLREAHMQVYFPDDFEYGKSIREIERCSNCLNGKPDKYCPYYSQCKFVSRNTANTVINKFSQFDEIIFYKNNFFVPKELEVSRDVDKTRKWYYDVRGYLCPKDGDETKLSDLQKSIFNSRKRALDNVYGYINCNDWKYFITVTFKHGKTDKLSDKDVMYQWQKFRQQLQYKFPNIGIFLIKEDSPTGVHGLHFHGFICGANIDDYLTPARNNKKEYNGGKNAYYGDFLYTNYGDPIYNFKKSLTNVGWTTVVKMKEANLLKCTNYITKYMTKGSPNFDYNENSYLHTNNLNFKNKEVAMLSPKEKTEFVSDISAVCYKETDKFTVYRVYKDLKGENL